MNDISTHITQFRLHFYKGDSIIKTKIDLNREQHIYCVEEDKIHKYEYYFDGEDKPEPFLKELGDYNSDDNSGCLDDEFYFYTNKDIFYIEYLHEVGEFDYTSDNNITKWLDEVFIEDEVTYIDSIIRGVYKDVKKEIDSHFSKNKYDCKFISERLITIQSHNYTTGYEYVEYECDISYIGLYKLAKPEPLSHNEMFKREHNGLNEEDFFNEFNNTFDI